MKNQNGSVVLVLAIVLAIISILIAYNSSSRTAKVAERARKTQGMNYAHQISASIARQLRRSYDLARAETKVPPIAPLCSTSGGTIINVGAIPLCFFGSSEICTVHPARSSLRICVAPGSTLVDRRNSLQRHRLIAYLLRGQLAFGSVYSPAPPLATDAANLLNQDAICLNGTCRLQCNGNADCLTFKFCPMITGNCSPDEFVTQTIGFPKI